MTGAAPASLPPGQGEQQLELLDPIEVEKVSIAQERQRGIFSGDLLKKYDPDKWEAIRRLIVEVGLSTAQIAFITKSSRNTVASMRESLMPKEIEHLRAKLARRTYHFSELCLERAIEFLLDPSTPASLVQLLTSYGIAIDKGQVMSGAPTSITADGTQPGAGVDDYLLLVRRRNGTGLEGGKGALKEARAIDGEVVVGPAPGVDRVASGAPADGRNEAGA